jgi:L-amino acid N-acyltransferase YncA
MTWRLPNEMTAIIRLARSDDAGQMLDIYAPFVRDSAVSFEVDVPTPEAFAKRVQNTLATLPWLVCESEGTVLGYAYASKHQDRAAYQWSVDVSAYISDEHRRQGVGTALYTSLFACLRLQGYYNAYAGVTLPNPASVGIHEAKGFTHVGTYHDVGHKFGQWHSVGCWELSLQGRVDPSAPINLPDIENTPEWAEALTSGVLLFKSSRY